MEHLATLSAQQILKDLVDNGGHPKPAFGEGETWRSYYLEECRRRGKRLLEDLGWTTDYAALYVNRYTGHIETLVEVVTMGGHFENHMLEDQAWAVIEHWLPYTAERYIDIRGDYLIENIRDLEAADEDTFGGSTYYKQQMEHLKELKKELADLLEGRWVVPSLEPPEALLKECEDHYEVVNREEIADNKGGILSCGKSLLDVNDATKRRAVTREDFENTVKSDYGTRIRWI